MHGLDRDWLEQRFSIRQTERSDALLTVRADAILTSEGAAAFLNEYALHLQATDVTAAAAYCCANFSWTALALHYSVGVWNVAFELPLSSILLQLYRDQGQLKCTLTLTDWIIEAGPEDVSERSSWRDRKLAHYYSETARPLIESLSAVSGLDVNQLWGQLPTRFNYQFALLEKELSQAGLPDGQSAAARLLDDYRAVCNEWDGSAFGRRSNPLNVNIRYMEDYRDPEAQVRMKNVCCLYYKTGKQEYCYTCPRLKAEDREKVKERLLTAGKH